MTTGPDPAAVPPRDAYREAGVDADEADRGLSGLVGRILGTWPDSGPGAVKLPLGYFANVVDIGGRGIALCTDGVGSKTIVADMLGRWDTIGIDCVAMNVNDLICVGARPVSMVDYIAVEKADSRMLEEIGIGLAAGAEQAGISISGGEISQLRDVVRGFDIVGMAVGTVALDRILDGSAVRPGDAVVGIESDGIHSNGLSLARRVFFDMHGLAAEHRFPELDLPLGLELLRPTDIYVREILAVLDAVPSVSALANITGDGFLNLTRVPVPVGYVLDDLPPPPPIFGLIAALGSVDEAEMHHVFNMGVGFCVTVPEDDADAVLAILRGHGRRCRVIGRVTDDATRSVRLPAQGVTGRGKRFRKDADG